MKIEDDFKKFLNSLENTINLDNLPPSTFNKKKADYYLKEHNVILEIKSINSDRREAFEPWINNKVSDFKEIQRGMPILFGTKNFRSIYEAHRNKKYFDKILDSHASKTLEGYIRSAKYQLRDTKQSLEVDKAIGILVILNQEYEFYETGFVYRVVQQMLSKLKEKSPEASIDGVLYINESKSSTGEIDTVFIHESNKLEDISPNEFLDNLYKLWAKHRGYGNT